MTKLTQDEITALPDQLPGWKVDGQTLVRRYSFASFPDAVAFVTRLGFDAEAADHHPDLHVNYRRVTVTWTTHSEGALTTNDVSGAEHADAVARTFPTD